VCAVTAAIGVSIGISSQFLHHAVIGPQDCANYIKAPLVLHLCNVTVELS